MIRSLALVLALVSFAGCKKKSEQAPQPAAKVEQAQPAQAGATDNKALCVEVMTRARTCTNDYIPALVDTRAKLDKPPGIAEEVKKNRDAVIKQAMDEWKNDSQDAAIAGMCEKMAAEVTPSDADAAKACLAKADCASYTTCVMPLFEKRIAK